MIYNRIKYIYNNITSIGCRRFCAFCASSSSKADFLHPLSTSFLKRSRAPDKLACRGRRERLQQAAEPPSSVCFAGCAVAFYTAAYGSASSLLRRAEPIQKLPGFSRTAIFQLSRVKCATDARSFSSAGFRRGIITRPPKVGDGTRRL